jgi:flagellar basal-body rod protein FlgC
MRYDPGHPSANAAGYVKMPNVNGLIEAMDMRQAQRSYEANIQAIEASKSMIMKTVDLLRG